MVSNGNKKLANEILEEPGLVRSPNGYGPKDQISVDIELSQMEVLDEDKRQSNFLNFFRAAPNKSGFVKLAHSPSVKFQQIASKKDEFSRSVVSEQTGRDRFYVHFIRKIDWGALWSMAKEWLRDPLNLALLFWIIGVIISGAILFLVMTGMLNHALPKKSQRNTWFEVNNQIINALFTLMCLYQLPKRCYHFFLLIRWETEDIVILRKAYCKNGTYKPHEWKHMMVVVLLLQLNCFAQYALCGLNWGYPRSRRPAIGVALCLSLALGGAAFAGLYNSLSPLGKEYEDEIDQEAQAELISSEVSKPKPARVKTLEKMYTFATKENQRVQECKPEWVGGLFDFWDDIYLAYLSVFCSCCIFGWNMERLGFGNMYVHILTFILFCAAPFFIFNLAAININDESVREALGIGGAFLCFLGLLYGGFWRIQMRRKYKLPANKFCCGKPSVTDCCQWLFCCSCSLAQEVRTADFYDVVEDKLYRKQEDSSLLPPLPREKGSPFFISTPTSPHWERSSPSIFKTELEITSGRSSGGLTPDRHMFHRDGIMSPPVPSFIQREG